MKKYIGIICAAMLLASALVPQSISAEEKELVLSLAQEDRKAAVAVDAYLAGNLLEAEVLAVMDDARPYILNVIFRGKGTGTIVPSAIEFVYAKPQEKDVYETIKKGAFLSIGKNSKEKELKGKRTRKLFTFEIPKDKIRRDGKYELKIRVGSIKQESGSKSKKTMFLFPLEKLPELVLGEE